MKLRYGVLMHFLICNHGWSSFIFTFTNDLFVLKPALPEPDHESLHFWISKKLKKSSSSLCSLRLHDLSQNWSCTLSKNSWNYSKALSQWFAARIFSFMKCDHSRLNCWLSFSQSLPSLDSFGLKPQDVLKLQNQEDCVQFFLKK